MVKQIKIIEEVILAEVSLLNSSVVSKIYRDPIHFSLEKKTLEK